MGGCGIAIKKRGSPVVMLLMMGFGQGENVTKLIDEWSVKIAEAQKGSNLFD